MPKIGEWFLEPIFKREVVPLVCSFCRVHRRAPLFENLPNQGLKSLIGTGSDACYQQLMLRGKNEALSN